MSFLGATINSNQSVAGRAAVYVGSTTASFDALPTAMYSVGACDGTVSISPNQDIVKLQRSDGQNPYAVLETAYDFQATFNLQEVDIYNLALACGYNVKDEAFVEQASGYQSTTSGHHGMLISNFTKLTTAASSGATDAIDSIIVADASPDTITISVDTDSNILDGFDATSDSPDWLILSGLTAPGLKGFNGIPLSCSSGEPGGTADEIIATSVEGVNSIGWFNVAVNDDMAADTYTHTSGAGSTSEITGAQLRRVHACDMITFTDTAGVKIVKFEFSETADIADFLEGDSLQLNGTWIGAAQNRAEVVPSGTAPSVNLLKEINGVPLRINDKTSNVLTCSVPHSSVATGTSTIYDSSNDPDNILMGYLDLTRKLVLGSDSQAGYRSLMLRVEGGMFDNAGAPAVAERQVAEWQFYKTKLVYGGSIDYDRTGAVSYPVVAHCLGNSNDVIGQFITPSEFTRTSYYGES